MEGLSFEAVYPFLWLLFLLDFALKGAVILTLAFAAERLLLRRASAAARHLVWFLALLAVVVQPLVTNLLPEWRVPLMPRILVNKGGLPAALPAEEIGNDETPQRFGERLLESPSVVAEVQTAEASPATLDLYDPLAGLTRETEAVPFRTGDSSGRGAFGTPHWSFWIFALWLAGFMIVVLRLLVGAVGAYLIQLTARREIPPELAKMVEPIASALGVKRRVRLLISDHMQLPKSGGILCPVIVLPAVALEWEQERCRLVLMHEMAHIKRWDILTLMVSRFACALNWFNPLAWAAHLRMRDEMERACDDMVINSGIVPSSYALHLAEIARSLRPLQPSWASAAMAHRSSLKDRLLAILDLGTNRRPFKPRRALTLAALILVLLLPLAVFHPWAAAESSKLGRIAEQAERMNPDDELENLLAALSDPDEEIRANAALLLGRWKAIDSTDHLMTALQDNCPKVRQYAAWALGQVQQECSIDSLTLALNDPVPEVRQQALWALGRMGVDSTGAFASGAANDDPFIRQQALHAMGRIEDDEAVSTLIAALDDEVNAVRRQAVVELARIGGERAISGLTKALRDPNTEIRSLAVSYLREISSPQTVPGLASALQDDANDVRRRAVDALAGLHEEAAIDPLIAAATSDPSIEIRIRALRELAKIDDNRVFPAFAASINSDSNVLRKEAVRGLCRLNDQRVIGLLNAILIESYSFRPLDDETRLLIIDSLVRFGHPSSKEALLHVLRNSASQAVRAAAQRALAGIS